MSRITLLLIAASSLFADSAPPVPAQAEAEYYRTDSVLAHMKPAWDTANADLQKAIADIQKICGDKFVPIPAEKHIVCVAKPETPKSEPPKAEKK